MIGILLVEHERRRPILNPQVSMEPLSQLGEIRAGVDVELLRQQTIGREAERGQQQREGHGAEQNQPGLEGQRHS